MVIFDPRCQLSEVNCIRDCEGICKDLQDMKKENIITKKEQRGIDLFQLATFEIEVLQKGFKVYRDSKHVHFISNRSILEDEKEVMGIIKRYFIKQGIKMKI